MFPKRCFLISLLFILAFSEINSQEAAAVDSLRKKLAEARTPEMKVFWMDNLSRTLMNVDLAQADSLGQQLILFAEETRDRKLMVQAYVSNGVRYSYMGGQKIYLNKSIEYYNKAMDIARQNKLEEEIGGINLRLAAINLMVPDKDKALSFANQAFSVISTLPNDSLRAESHNTYGQVYLSRNDKTLALRHFLTALRIAEGTKNYPLLRNCYLYLATFYTRIEDYDRAIDYHTLAMKQLDYIRENYVPYQRAIDINGIGNLFAYKKNYDIAITYFKRSIALADSLRFSTLKIPAYISLLNQYLRMDEPQKALGYMNSQEGQLLKQYMTNFGFGPVIDQTYGVIYTASGNYDSARTSLLRALPYFEQRTNETNRLSFYGQLAHFYKKTNDHRSSITYFLKVKELGEKLGSLENVRAAAKQLDTLYAKTGQHELSAVYSDIYHQYKDSIEKLNKEKELAQVEAADEQQREARRKAEEEEKKRKRHSIQYMGITIGIVALFIVMVMLGFFRVSATTIRIIGFFVFLLFFEFVFLIFKKNIYGITKGEPWKDLAFVIALAAILVPLHHWLEHKVIHFLTSHHMLKFRSMFGRKQVVNDEAI